MFDPDRFLDARVQKYLIPNPFIFLPFNAGPRICLGQEVRHLPQSLPCHLLHLRPVPSREFRARADVRHAQFVYNEVSFMLVRLLQRFSGICLRADVHPAAVPPPGAERSRYVVDGCERVWFGAI